MTQAHPVPYVHARDSLVVEDMTSRTVALIGACERTNQIQLRAGIDDPSDAAQNAIHFAKCSKSIDVNRLQACGLRKQFFVQHFDGSPHWWKHHLATTQTWLQQFCDMRHQNVIGTSA